MIIGIDFDNTIVAYDELFHRLATERKLVPTGLPSKKTAVRDHLRATGREDLWTEMQGEVYGRRMSEATAFPGVLQFFKYCQEQEIPVRIISHKTRQPFRGTPCDLHAAARGWLREQGFFNLSKTSLREDEVFFELTKIEKLERVRACHCTHFIDDLPEILRDPSFPSGVQRYLFDPEKHSSRAEECIAVSSWSELSSLLSTAAFR